MGSALGALLIQGSRNVEYDDNDDDEGDPWDDPYEDPWADADPGIQGALMIQG